MSFRSKKIRLEALQRNPTEVTSSSPGSKEQCMSLGLQMSSEKTPQQSRPSGSTISNKVNNPSAGEASRPTLTSSSSYRMLPQNLPKLSKSFMSEKTKMLPEKKLLGNQVMYGPFTPSSSLSHLSRNISFSSSTASQSRKTRDSGLSNSSLTPSGHNPSVEAFAALQSGKGPDSSLSSPSVLPSGHKPSVPMSGALHSKKRQDANMSNSSLMQSCHKPSASSAVHAENCRDSSLSNPSFMPSSHKLSFPTSTNLHSESHRDSNLSNTSPTPFVNKPSFQTSTTVHSEKHQAPSLSNPTLKRPPSNLEFFELTHKPKDGEFPDNSMSKEFLEQAKSKVEESLANSSSSSKSEVDLENDIFNELMYEEGELKRPIGYGFGVNKSAIFGVHGELRNRGYRYADNVMETRLLTKHNQELNRRNQINEAKINESNRKINQSNQLLLQLLDAMSAGRVTKQFLSSTRQKVLRMTEYQVPMGSGGHCDTNSQSMEGDIFCENDSGDNFDDNDNDSDIGSQEDTPSSNYSPSP